MSLTPAEHQSLLAALFAKLRGLETAYGLDPTTVQAVDSAVVRALPDKTFGGAVTVSSLTRVIGTLINGEEDPDYVRSLTLAPDRALPLDDDGLPLESSAALLILTLCLNGLPIYVESDVYECLDTEVLDAVVTGDAQLHTDVIDVHGVAMTRSIAALSSPEVAARTANTARSAMYARRSDSTPERVLALIDRGAGTASWLPLARRAVATIPTLRAPSRDRVHLLRFGALKPLRLTPRRVAAPARPELPALRFRERAAPIPAPVRAPTDRAATRTPVRTVNHDPRALPQNLRVVPVTAPFRPRPR